MSASRNKKERKDEAALGLTEKEKEAQALAVKSKQKTIIYSVIGVVVAVLIAILLFWDSGFLQKRATAVTVGDKSYKVVDVDYFYYSTLNGYGSNAESYGLDLSKPLDEQEAYEGYTWDDVLTDNALTSLNSVSVLAAKAQEAGYELSEDGQDMVEEAMINAESYASLYGVSEEQYLRSSFGKYMTVEDYERIMTEIQLAGEYGTKMMEDMDVSDEEIQTFYTEHASDLDTIDYNCYLVSFETTQKDASGSTIPLDDATIEENRKAAEARAQEILDALVDGNTVEAAKLATIYDAVDDSNMSGISSSGFADWMADSTHQAGSYDLVENKHASTNDVIGYFAIYVNSRELDEYNGKDLRVLRVAAASDEEGEFDMAECKTRAEKLLANFEETGKTSEDFAEIYANAAADKSYPGGLRENISKKHFNEEMTEWIFDDTRKQGDYALFEDDDSHSCYILFYEQESDLPYWKSVCITNVQQNKYVEWLDAELEACPPVEDSGMKYVG